MALALTALCLLTDPKSEQESLPSETEAPTKTELPTNIPTETGGADTYPPKTADKTSPVFELNYTDGLIYEPIYGGTEYAFKGIGELKDAEEIIIPPSYNGKPVTEIRGEVYESIHNGPKRVYIPPTVERIDPGSFLSMEIEEIYISDLTAWCKIDFITQSSTPLFYANKLFLNGELLTEVIFPEELTEVKKYTFSGCAYIKSIKLHDNITKIGQYAFQSCVSLEGISIPSGIDTVPEGAFQSCLSLENVELSNGLRKVDALAFKSCTALKKIVFPNGFEQLGNNALSDCTSLKEVVLPESIESIFSQNIKPIILYNGYFKDWNKTERYWAAREKEDGKITLVCLDTTVNYN